MGDNQCYAFYDVNQLVYKQWDYPIQIIMMLVLLSKMNIFCGCFNVAVNQYAYAFVYTEYVTRFAKRGFIHASDNETLLCAWLRQLVEI